MGSNQEKTIASLRKGHNVVKQFLLERAALYISRDDESQSFVVLDIGFGKGGDLHKFAAFTPRLHTIAAIEPNLINWTEAQKRWKKSEYQKRMNLVGIQIGETIQTINIPQCQQQIASLVKQSDEPVVSCMFFSFAYACDTTSTMERLVHLWKSTNTKIVLLTFMDENQLTKMFVNQSQNKIVIDRSDGQQIIELLDERRQVRVTVTPSQTARGIVEPFVDMKLWSTILHNAGFKIHDTQLFSHTLHSDDPWDHLYRWQIIIQNK